MSPQPQPWIPRLHQFAAKLSRKDALQLAEDLQELTDFFGEASELLEELKPQLETWSHDDVPRDERLDAKDVVDDLVNQIEEHLIALHARLQETP